MYLISFIIILILIIILVLVYKIYKNNLILCDRDKDFIVFTIDMYIEYAEELEIDSGDKHEVIVGKLNRIKETINGK